MRLWSVAAALVVVLFATSVQSKAKDGHYSAYICKPCELLVKGAQFLYGRKITQDKLIELLVYLCRTAAHEESAVCKAMGGQFRDQIIYVFRELVLKPDQFCGLLYNKCGDFHNPFHANWTIKLPQPPKVPLPDIPYPTNPPSTLRVLQLSDLHFDMAYAAGSEAKCDLPICCQNAPSEGPVKSPAGYWGTLSSCDLPYRTIENMFQHLSRTSDDFDYVMLTGDYMSHNDWSYTREQHKEIIAILAGLFERYLPKKPVYWAIGNHEGVPVNSFAPRFAPKQFHATWLYDSISRAERRWLDYPAKKDMQYRGSYNIKINDKLRLITLNTGYCMNTNFWIYVNQTDPDGSMSWFVEQLSRAEEKKQFVHVMAHVPPGNEECLEGWALNYYNIVNRFKQTITGQFFGHTHVDSFTLFYEDMDDAKSRPSNMHYTAPSVTTYEGLNPAYRIYTIEGNYENSRFRVLDYDNYFLNLTNLETESDTPRWEKLYSAKSEYDLPDLSADSWNRLIDRIIDDEEVFDRFVKNYVRRDDYICDTKCRKELICSLKKAHHNDKALCPEVAGTLEAPGKHVTYDLGNKPTVDGSTQGSFLDNLKSAVFKKAISWIPHGDAVIGSGH